MQRVLAGVLASGLLVGCVGQTPPQVARFLAAPPPPEAALAEATRRLRAMLAGYEALRLARGALPEGAGPHEPGAGLRARLAAAEATAAVVDGGRLAPVPGRAGETLRLDTRWRQAAAMLFLAPEPPAQGRPFRFPGLEAGETVIHLRTVAPEALAVAGRCDGAVRLWDDAGSRPSARAGETFRLTLRAGGTPQFALGPEATGCTLEVGVEGRPGRHRVTLEREEAADPALAALDTGIVTCPVLPAGALDPLEAAVLSDRWLNRSCVLPVGRPAFHDDNTAAFNARAEALTGRPLDPDAIAAGDPEMPLDFSAAPRLRLIYVSFLHIRADFSGRMLVRMLEHHAAQGATIRILVSASLTLGRDKAMLGRLAARHPNVQLQLYDWHAPDPLRPVAVAEGVQRSHHIKVFATLAEAPGRSRFMVGGRNLHDGFLFDTPRDLSAHPLLHQYGSWPTSPLAFFAAYDDFEMTVADDASVRALIAQMGAFWHRDAPSSVTRPATLGVEVPAAPRRGMVHFVSVPQADGRALERWYVELLEAARDRVDLVSPYLNLTPALEAALERTLARGVAVRVIVPERLPRDPLAGIKADLNGLFVTRFGERAEILQHRHPTRLLHSKMVLIDGRFAMVSSINLNRRSFLHDTENALAVLDRGFHDRLMDVVEGYAADSVPAAAPPEPRLATQALLRMPRLLDLF